MIRGLNLALAALVVVSFGVSSVFAFTPSVAAVPDVIIGDRTPDATDVPTTNDLPSDPFTHADSLEDNVYGTADNVYAFPDAINIFNYAGDEPAGFPGFTSDAQLIYEFFASNVFPATAPLTAGERRISINGTRISTGGFTTVTVSSTGLLSFRDEAFSADADNNVAPASPPSFSYLFTNTAGSETITTGTATPQPGTVAVLDQVTMTVRVTNQTAASDTDTFFVTTVEEGADALSGSIGTPGVPQDLSLWIYNGSASRPYDATTNPVFGPTYPGDAQVTGEKLADGDTDGSVNDLSLTTGDTTGDFFHSWTSAAAIIPFQQDGTYHLTWNVSSTIATANSNPYVRLRWEYTAWATLGGGDTVLAPPFAVAPAAGRNYYTMFDQLDVAALTGTVPFLGDVENTIRLVFEAYDFDGNFGLANVGGGQVELNSLEIANIDRTALLAQQTVERQATDYTNPIVAITGVDLGGNSITVTPTATNFSITSPLPGVASTAILTLYGAGVTVNDRGMGFAPFTPAATSGRVYRATADVDTTANVIPTAPLPTVTLTLATFTAANAQIFTSTREVQAKSQSLNAENPVANGLNNYSIYMALPDGFSLGAGQPLGERINATTRLTDYGTDSITGGTVTVDNMTITSFPESILP